ncbi:hypothetical protein BDY24DRAFT_131018 [Mrakia frigida]|uniref:acylglycerol kinase family protein n=1 Tax=Mrakia frigida TaxID=29902 RepID=UPI003FCC1F0D
MRARPVGQLLLPFLPLTHTISFSLKPPPHPFHFFSFNRMTRFLSIILNPTSGARTSTTFLNETLLPLLEAYNGSPTGEADRIEWEILTSEKENDGVRLGELLRARWEADEKEEVVRAVVLGGDGTSHELIEGFFPPSSLSTNTPSAAQPTLELVPLPLGTANALFNTLHPPSTLVSPLPSFASSLNLTEQQTWSLRSLLSYLSSATTSSSNSKENLLPLPLTLTTLLPPVSSTLPPVKLLTHIVLSTAMHASLLERSETFRAQYPGVERFKLAAEQVLSLPFPGRLTLLAPHSSNTNANVLRYSPTSKTFQPLSKKKGLVLDGPFAYVLSSTVVSRLEASFVIQPLLERDPPGGEGGTMDLMVLRPGRCKKVMEGEEWERVVRGVMGGAYHDGKHVEELIEDAVVEGEGGEGVTEVYRVGGWVWEPQPSSSNEQTPSHVICADGAIHRVPVGGKAVVEVLGTGSGGDVKVWR